MLIIAAPAVFAPAVPVQSQPPPPPIHHDATPSALLSFSCSVFGLMHVCLSKLDPRWPNCHASGGRAEQPCAQPLIWVHILQGCVSMLPYQKVGRAEQPCTRACEISSRPSMPRWQGIILIYVCLCSSCTNPNASELASHPARGRCL